jgi:sugar phosphate isomerase/epimerase
MSLEQFAATVVSKLNVPGIEPWSPHFRSIEPEYVHSLYEHFHNAGLHVVNIPVDMPAKLCGTPEERTAALSKYRQWVDAAVILKSPGIRVHLPRGETGDEISCSVSALKELAAYGASKNIVINLENDIPDLEQPERIVKVIKAVNSPFLHALPDFCNSMLVHDDAGYNYQAMRMLFPLAFNISHVKDEESGNHGEVYHVDVNRIFDIANQIGYRGYFSMEFEGQGDPYEGCRKLIEASLRNLELDVPAR